MPRVRRYRRGFRERAFVDQANTLRRQCAKKRASCKGTSAGARQCRIHAGHCVTYARRAIKAAKEHGRYYATMAYSNLVNAARSQRTASLAKAGRLRRR